MLQRLLDDYFGFLSESEQRHFLIDLDRQHAIYGAVGLGTIPSDFLRKSAMFTFWITIFTTQQRGFGWVVPTQNHSTIATTDPKALADGHAEINAGMRLVDWGTKGLDDILQAYSEYLNTARNYEDEGRTEEALLHSVFALDLLLGGESGDSLTAVLADRVAMLSHLALKQDLQEIVRFVRETYDMRSGYVHRGQRGKLSESTRETLIDRLGRLKAITRAVNLVLLVLRGINRGARFLKRERSGFGELTFSGRSWRSAKDSIQTMFRNLGWTGLNWVRARPPPCLSGGQRDSTDRRRTLWK